MLPALGNFFIYQAVWFIAVTDGNRGIPLCCLLLLLHLLFSNRKLLDIVTMAAFIVVGVIVDGTLSRLGLFSFREPGLILPLWLMIIWLALGITPHHSLAWMKNRPITCSVFGSIGGPAAYWAGIKFGAAVFHWPLTVSLFTLAVTWSLVWPLVMYYSIWLEERFHKKST